MAKRARSRATSKRSRAARKGWETRRRKAQERSDRARRGWETRKRKKRIGGGRKSKKRKPRRKEYLITPTISYKGQEKIRPDLLAVVAQEAKIETLVRTGPYAWIRPGTIELDLDVIELDRPVHSLKRDGLYDRDTDQRWNFEENEWQDQDDQE